MLYLVGGFMQKYFISCEELNNLRITSDDVNHIKNVTRSRIGDEVIVSDQKREYLVAFTKIENKLVEFEIKEELTNLNELPVYVDIYQGYPKGDKLDDIVKHATELGVNGVYATFMKRSIIKLDSKKISSKIERYKKIAKEAAEQSFRKIIPDFDIKYLNEIDFSAYDIKLIAYEENAYKGELVNFKTAISSARPGSRIAIIIGPEGGIDTKEIEYLKEKGFVCCAFGRRILRTETAPLYALSAISYELELKK